MVFIHCLESIVFKSECTSYGANEMELFSKLKFTTTFTLISSHLVEATSSLVQANGFKAIAFRAPPGAHIYPMATTQSQFIPNTNIFSEEKCFENVVSKIYFLFYLGQSS